MLIVLPLLSTVTSEAVREPFLAIYIDGNDQFTSENGVRSGSGTVSDPYIINDWHITANPLLEGGAAITIMNTDRHVVLMNNRIEALIPAKYGTRIGIHIENSSNISVYQNFIGPAGTGIWLKETRGVVVDENIISDYSTNISPVVFSVTGILVYLSHDAVITNNTITALGQGISAVDSTTTAIHSNQLLSIGPFTAISLTRSDEASVQNNTVEDSDQGFRIRDSSATLHNNTISARVAILGGNSSLNMTGNIVAGQEITFPTLTNFAGNGIKVGKVTFANPGPFSNNSFDSKEIRYFYSGTLNLEFNWWGDSEGPRYTSFIGEIDYTPWLSSHPS